MYFLLNIKQNINNIINLNLNNYTEIKFPLKNVKEIKNLPDSFDPSDLWSYCSGINIIHDVGSCLSDFAVIVADTASDRLCIASKGKINVRLSAEDILTCCDDCGSCDGGSYSYAWRYLNVSY